MDTQLTILEEAVSLLKEALDEATKKLPIPEEKNVRRAYINRHGWNIHDLSADVITLGRAGNLGSIYLLARPALESLFKMSAALNEENFAAEKLVAEVEEEREKFESWRASGESAWTETLDKMIKGLKDYEGELRQRYSVNGQRRWRKTWEVAKAGKLQAEYVKDYFLGSKHVHAMLSALVAREDGLYIIEALNRLTVTVCHASALIGRFFYVCPNVFDDALDIQERANAAFKQAQKELEKNLKPEFSGVK
jgi:hypothetical protein